VGAGGGVIASHLQQVRPHGVKPVMGGQPAVGLQACQQLEPGRGPLHHRHRDRPVERDHRAGRGPPQQLVKGEDLRPVSVLGTHRLVVERGIDARLDRHHPGEGWSRYLKHDYPKWSRIIVAGWSQGGGNAALIACDQRVARVIMLEAPVDRSQLTPPVPAFLM
jgi:hypothetical protein